MSPMNHRLLRPRRRAAGSQYLLTQDGERLLTEAGQELMTDFPSAYDADALVYLNAVEAADGQALEDSVKTAINDFVVGCKSDGIWDAIKASCVLMGARTLSGALTPLVGPAPTNNNFVSGDYNRKTGLIGNASTKYLNAGLAYNALPTNSEHLAIYKETAGTVEVNFIGGGLASGSLKLSRLAYFSSTARFDVQDNALATYGATNAVGFVAASRDSAAGFEYRQSGASTAVSRASVTRADTDAGYGVFVANYGDIGLSGYSNARLSFYSIGEAIDLAALDARASALIAAIGAAIP